MKTRIHLKLAGKQLSTKTKIQSFLQKSVFQIFHFFIFDNLVYMLTLFSLFG